MAQVTGITCDNCQTFVAHKPSPGKAGLPPGWYEVYVVLESGERTLVAEVCSGRCLERIARIRKELDKPVLAAAVTNRVTSINAGGGRDRAGHRMAHLVKGIVNPDCKYCQEETAP